LYDYTIIFWCYWRRKKRYIIELLLSEWLFFNFRWVIFQLVSSKFSSFFSCKLMVIDRQLVFWGFRWAKNIWLASWIGKIPEKSKKMRNTTHLKYSFTAMDFVRMMYGRSCTKFLYFVPMRQLIWPP
jgi:hypothetical protein